MVNLWKSLFLVSILFLGCTPLTLEEKEDREYRYQDKLNKWVQYEQNCYNSRGTIWVCNARESVWQKHPWIYCGCVKTGDLYVF